MDERRHFTRFKGAHRRMQVAKHIETSPFTPNGHDAPETRQETLHVADEHLPDHMPVRQWFREWLRRNFGQGWEHIVVNRSVDSVTMPKWVASAILVAILGFGAASWWRSSDQRDMLIELKTELRLTKEREAEKADELQRQANLNKVYIDNMTNQLNVIKGMLSQQQLTTVDRARGDN